MAILVLGDAEDVHAMHVLDRLACRGADAVLIDSRDFPAKLKVSFDPGTGLGRLSWPSGRRLDLADIRAVYWRSYHGIVGPDLPDLEQSYLAANDARSLFESLLIRVPARWVNGWRAYQSHQTKPVQLARVAALGVPIPRTLLTNDPDALVAFDRDHPRAIFKPVQGGAHARPLTAAHLTEEHTRNLVFAPVTVQEEIAGTSIRVFVVADRVLCCAIHTQALDYRDDPAPRLERCEVPSEVEGWCRAAARELDLVWTGIDLRRTPEGQYVFLEANPSPMFLGFEAATGLPLTDALVDLLMS